MACVLFNFSGCTDSESNLNNNSTDITEIKAAIIESNNEFAFKIFSSIAENDDSETNLFLSPLSLYYALSMAANGANGETYESFKQTLGYNFEKEQILEDIKSLYEQLIPDDDKLMLEIANSIWTDETFKVKKNYNEELIEYFYAVAQSLDFTKPESVDIINNWIAEKTYDKILKMLNEISPDEVLFLINAIYFKGDWLYTFDEEANTLSKFSKETDTDITIEFMNLKSDFKYFSNHIFSAVQLPYADTNYFMTIFLPSINKTATEIIDFLNNDEWSRISNDFEEKTVAISIPKFKFEYGVRNIKNELIDMGLSIAFTPDADFSGISDLGLAISRVLHKAFIEVNEKGSEAAAATIVGVELTSVDPNLEFFIADHPFIFTISEKITNTVLFIGKVAEPVYE